MQDIFLAFLIPFYVIFIALFSYFISKRLPFSNSFFFIFLFNLIMNLFGVVFTLVFYFVFKNRRERDENLKILSLDLERLFFSYPKAVLSFRSGAFDTLLRNENVSEDRKVKFLSYIREKISKEGIEPFYSALSSRSDESRLLAFTTINNMEKDLNEKIEEIKKSDFENKEEKLAFLYWEFVYFKLATGDLKDFYLKRAKEFAKEALKKDFKNENIFILLGKIYLEERDYENAKEAFNKAIFLGASKRSTLPYLAQIYFENRDFEDFRRVLVDLSDLKYNPKISSIFSFWTGK